MNELEHTSAETNELANPTIPENAEEKTSENVTEQTAEVAEEKPENAEVVVEINYSKLDKKQLVEALAAIVDENRMTAHKEVGHIKKAFDAIRNAEKDVELSQFIDAGNEPAAFAPMPDADEARFKELLGVFREKRNEYLAAEEARKEANLAEKQRILDRLKEIATDIDNVNVNFSEFQQLQSEFKAVKDVPEQSENEIWKNYQIAVQEFYDHMKMNKELRDLDFKKNLDAKRLLIDQAVKLAQDAEADVVESYRKLQDLHMQWREIGPVAKDLRDSIWEEFKAASTIIRKRHQEFFENRKANEKANEDAKTKLCEEIEAIDLDTLKTFNAWEEATKKIKDLQAQWKTLGFASRKVNTALFNRFRQSCDAFFAAKAEFFTRTKEEFSTNLAKKEALVAEAEGLQATDDVRKAIERIVQLQAEWKKIGAVARKHSDDVWKRFQAACNFFFEERRKQNAETRQTENANLAAKRQVIADLKEIPTDIERNDAIAKVRELQAQWNKIGHVPYRVKDKLYEEYRAAVNALYETYNIREAAGRMSRYESRIDAMKGDDKQLNKERDKMMRVLEAKRNELATFENNLGFFNVKSSAGSSMVADMERRIRRVQDEIDELEKKLDLLNN